MEPPIVTTEKNKDWQLTLKADHHHQRILHKKGTKLEVFKPSSENIAFLKEHKII